MALELFEEHIAIVEAADEFLAAVKRTPRIPINQLSRLRMRLSTLLRKHRMTEEEHIYGPLMRGGGFAGLPELEPLMQDLQRAKAKYSEHVRKWTPQAIEQDWDGYVAACEERIDAMKRLVREEEARIYQPVLGLNAARPPRRAARL